MSTSKTVSPDERAMKLMAYADGELEGDELAEVEQWIREDAKSVLFANDLAELGSIIKEGHPPAETFDLTDMIMAKVAAEPPPVVKPKVSSLAAARGAREKKRNAALWVAAGIALAASIFLVTRNKGDEAPLSQATSPLTQPAAAANVAAASTAAAVDVENAGKSVSVFYLPNENPTTAPNQNTHVMIWVDESEGKK